MGPATAKGYHVLKNDEHAKRESGKDGRERSRRVEEAAQEPRQGGK